MEFNNLLNWGKATLLGAALMSTTFSADAGLFSADVYPADLRCEYMKSPLGMDLDSPRLFWKVETKSRSARGLSQTAYQIQAATDAALLKKDNPDLWDTGIVYRSDSTQIDYTGAPLDYPMNCFWRVRIADQNGKWSKWSQPASWVMGPMEMNDWTASWIGSDETFQPKDDIFEPCMSNPWMRKTYDLAEVPAQAFLHVASAGFHEVYINGQKVDNEVLTPNVSDLKRNHVRYKTYDIAPYLKKGKNAVVFWLGVGWVAFPEFKNADRPLTPIVMAQADLTFKSDAKTRWVTDSTWKTHSSPSYLLGKWIWHQFGGDFYDANQELPGWNTAELDDSDWKAATVYSPKNMIVTAEKLPGNVIVQPTLTAISTEMLDDGVVKVDMGKNFSGWTTMKLKGKPGSKITMTWSERPDLRNCFGMCSAYVFDQTGVGTFRHHFNYNSGRWIYITGLDEAPAPENFTGNIVTTDLERVGYFECDKELFNRLYDVSLWTFQSLALGGYIVDCPQRERLGYGGDGNATINVGIGNYDMAAFYNKWAEDWRGIQSADGRLLHTAPTYIGGGGPSWSGFIIMMPWEIYLQYGDTRILKECYPNMKKWLGFLEANSKDDLIVPWGEFWDKLGDWLPPGTTGGGTPEENQCMNDYYWIYNLETAAEIAGILGYADDAKAYMERAEKVRKAANAKYYDKATGKYLTGRQAYQATAILANAPETQEDVVKTWDYLANDIRTRQHIDASITGGAFLFRVLIDAERNDLIYPMVAAEDYPGWGDMILNRGATTFIENWDESDGHSRLHSSYMYVGNWFIEGLGGIRNLEVPGGNGFQFFEIVPGYVPGKDLTQVKSSYNSLQGKIVSDWKVKNGKMTAKVTVPPNCQALMKFPAVVEKVSEKGKPLSKVKGVMIPEKQAPGMNGAILQSGTYTFTIDLE